MDYIGFYSDLSDYIGTETTNDSLVCHDDSLVVHNDSLVGPNDSLIGHDQISPVSLY
jgi:hypothetical protein